MINDNKICELNKLCKDAKVQMFKGTYSLYGGVYNVKDKDGNYLMEERVEVEESEDIKNGDEVLYCEICRGVEF